MKFDQNDNYTPPPIFDGGYDNSTDESDESDEFDASDYRELEKMLVPYIRDVYADAHHIYTPAYGCVEDISKQIVEKVKERNQRKDLDPIHFRKAYAKTTARHGISVHIKKCLDCNGSLVYESQNTRNEEENDNNWFDELLLKDVRSLSQIEQTAHCAILLKEFLETLTRPDKEFLALYYMGYSYQEICDYNAKHFRLEGNALNEKKNMIKAYLRKRKQRIRDKLEIFMEGKPPVNDLSTIPLSAGVVKY